MPKEVKLDVYQNPEDLKPDTFDLHWNPAILELKETPWLNFPYKPEVTIGMAWNRKFIFLNFSVNEREIRALANESNGKVWEDSCVEFFVSMDQDEFYYNFEINCIGTCLLAYGKTKENRILAREEDINSIIRKSSLSSLPFSNSPSHSPWSLKVVIPPRAFFRHSLREFQTGKIRGNFYKCGDKLAEPHFITWKRIDTKEPDFHQPAFFGDINFQPLSTKSN